MSYTAVCARVRITYYILYTAAGSRWEEDWNGDIGNRISRIVNHRGTRSHCAFSICLHIIRVWYTLVHLPTWTLYSQQIMHNAILKYIYEYMYFDRRICKRLQWYVCARITLCVRMRVSTRTKRSETFIFISDLPSPRSNRSIFNRSDIILL